MPTLPEYKAQCLNVQNSLCSVWIGDPLTKHMALCFLLNEALMILHDFAPWPLVYNWGHKNEPGLERRQREEEKLLSAPQAGPWFPSSDGEGSPGWAVAGHRRSVYIHTHKYLFSNKKNTVYVGRWCHEVFHLDITGFKTFLQVEVVTLI